jgi:hypothetical protein
MKNLSKITFFLLTIILFSCKGKDYKYKIEGNIMATNPKPYTYLPTEDTTKSLRPAIAYTDTIYGYNEDSIWYYNSDGSKLTLLAPYKIYKIK